MIFSVVMNLKSSLVNPSQKKSPPPEMQVYHTVPPRDLKRSRLRKSMAAVITIAVDFYDVDERQSSEL